MHNDQISYSTLHEETAAATQELCRAVSAAVHSGLSLPPAIVELHDAERQIHQLHGDPKRMTEALSREGTFLCDRVLRRIAVGDELYAAYSDLRELDARQLLPALTQRLRQAAADTRSA